MRGERSSGVASGELGFSQLALGSQKSNLIGFLTNLKEAKRLKMRAIAAFPGTEQPRLVDLPEPVSPESHQVLCRSLELGICGTDREILAAKSPLCPPGEDFLVLGHESLARVEEAGSAVEELAPGDLVVPVVRRPRPSRSPAAVRWRRRRVDLLPMQAYVERGIVRQHGFSSPYWLDEPRYLWKVPTEIADLAVLTEPLSVAAKAINEAQLLQEARLGQGAWQEHPPRVLITGLGPIAFAALVMARACRWPVWVWGRDEPDSSRAELVRDWGAQYLHGPVPQQVLKNVEEHGFDLMLDCTGAEEVVIRFAPAVASCGVIAWLGSRQQLQGPEVVITELIRVGLVRNHIHLGCVNAAPRDFQEALEVLQRLASTSRPLLKRLITHRVPLEQSLELFHRRPPQTIKVVVEF